MIYGSICSGIEAATAAWDPLGWRPAFFSEIEPFPRAVLSHHYPDVPLHGDFTTIEAGDYEPINLLVGGTPCQDFSVAGLRAGLAGERGNLTLEFVRLADRLRPAWIVWENVPGILSDDGGGSFGAFLGALAVIGYGFAYRVLDAQYAGLAQRRERVFVVGYLGDWRRAAAVLFERESLSGNPPPRREAGKGVAPTISARPTGGGGLGTDFDLDGGLIAAFGGNDTRGPIDVATACNAHNGPHGRLDFGSETFVAHTLRAAGFDAGEDGTGRGTPLVPVAFSCKDHGADAGDLAPTLRAMGHDGSHANAGGQLAVMTLAIRGRGDSHNLEYRTDGTANAILTPNGGRGGIGVGAVAFAQNQRGEVLCKDVADSLKVGGGKPGQGYPAAMQGMAVRRLTPRECERLQGFPDDFTLIPYRGKPAADGPRYKALGNSMAVPCMRWIGERVAMVDALDKGDSTDDIPLERAPA